MNVKNIYMGNSKQKTPNYKEKDTLARKGTRKYQERLQQEKEAKESIREYEDRTDERRVS